MEVPELEGTPVKSPPKEVDGLGRGMQIEAMSVQGPKETGPAFSAGGDIVGIVESETRVRDAALG